MAHDHKQQQIQDAAQEFATVRGRPALLLGMVDSMDLEHALTVQKLLADASPEELDVLLHSPGGSIHAAYQIVEVLRLRADRLYACVPFYAKSAATLICVGADEIHMDELAQLGPLDTQIEEERKGGKKEFTSALNPFKTLEQLQEFALDTLDIATQMIALRSDMDLDECLGHSIEFVKATTGPLFNGLDPEKLGTYSRALSVGEEYAKRLLTRFTDLDDDDIRTITHRLVHAYPSHDYIIDFQEVRELGLPARLFDSKEQAAARKVLKEFVSSRTTSILLAEPSEDQDTDAKHSQPAGDGSSAPEQQDRGDESREGEDPRATSGQGDSDGE